jgi:hypothetical protein
VDVTAREATDISDEDSEVLAVNTFPNILVDGRKVLDCPQHSLRLVKSSDKTGMDLKDDERACLAHTTSHTPDSPNRQPPMMLISLDANSRGMWALTAQALKESNARCSSGGSMLRL